MAMWQNGTTARWIDGLGDRVDDRLLGLPDGTLEAAAELALNRGVEPDDRDAVSALLDEVQEFGIC